MLYDDVTFDYMDEFCNCEQGLSENLWTTLTWCLQETAQQWDFIVVQLYWSAVVDEKPVVPMLNVASVILFDDVQIPRARRQVL